MSNYQKGHGTLLAQHSGIAGALSSSYLHRNTGYYLGET